MDVVLILSERGTALLFVYFLLEDAFSPLIHIVLGFAHLQVGDWGRLL